MKKNTLYRAFACLLAAALTAALPFGIREALPEKSAPVKASAFRAEYLSAGPNEFPRFDTEELQPQIGFSRSPGKKYLSAGWYELLAVKNDGSLLYSSDHRAEDYAGGEWKELASVSSGMEHSLGLKKDGTVLAAGENKEGRCDVSGWRDIKAVSAGLYHSVGLREDGRVEAVGSNEYGQCDVEDWENIVDITAGDYHTVGLRSDGRVLATGLEDMGRCNVLKWKNVVDVDAGWSTVLGLKEDGTVYFTGLEFDGIENVRRWKDIVSVSTFETHAVGLKSDGTVVAAGCNDSGQCDVEDWKGVTAVAAGWHCTAGLTDDGRILFAGLEPEGDSDYHSWRGLQQNDEGAELMRKCLENTVPRHIAAGEELIYDSGGIEIYRLRYYLEGRYNDLCQEYRIVNNSSESCSLSPDPSFIAVELEGFKPGQPRCSYDKKVTVKPGESGTVKFRFSDAFVSDFVYNIDKNGSFSIEVQMGLASDGRLVDIIYDKAVCSD